MRVEQARWMESSGWGPGGTGSLGGDASLVLLFGSRRVLSRSDLVDEVRRRYPHARRIGCSTAGEILGTEVTDDTLVATAVRFESTRLAGSSVTVGGAAESRDAGRRLAGSLDPAGLTHVFVLSDGLHVNGSELVRGLAEALPPQVTVTGGLSGDGSAFEETLVFWEDDARPGRIAVLGLYGERLKVGYGSLGGWDPFGPERVVTRSDGNVLYELDGRSALGLYKEYLGEHAAGLPASGLLFPLSVRNEVEGTGVVRTILAVSEKDESLTFAGDVPVGSIARLMKANFDRLVDGAVGAARTSATPLGSSSPELAILISCVGRKLILKQRIEDEVEGVREVLGPKAALTGFYSYGEISPFTPDAKCELHNQTMTITTLSEG